MIRNLQETDVETVANIWLAANREAHDFIPAQYWQEHFACVKGMLAQAEVYVHEDGGKIQGFVGLQDAYIAGIFVSNEFRSKGIGKRFIDFIKGRKDRLCLQVYQRNARAIRFYQREGFRIQNEGMDEHIGEKDYTMVWERKREPESLE